MGHRHAELADLGASVVGIANTAIYSQQAFAERLGLTFPLLSDWGGAVSEAYGVRYDEWKGHACLAKRSIFVVDAAGTIRFAWVTDDAAVQPDFDDVIAAVAAVAG